MRALSIAKPNQGTINEDAAIVRQQLLAVSDGAGGGGIYADKWSRYLVENLPDNAICSFEELDQWIDSIWEPFYETCEQQAKSEGGLVLNKFYEEGSFATLAAVWIKQDRCYWVAYGDSVAFCYNPRTGILQHSFTRLADFNKPPYLINYKNELSSKGCRVGSFETENGDIVFCASDALSHYILMMYKLSCGDTYSEELMEVETSCSKEATFIRQASSQKIDFYNDVIKKILNCKSKYFFERHLKRLYDNKLIALDDYSFAYMTIK